MFSFEIWWFVQTFKMRDFGTFFYVLCPTNLGAWSNIHVGIGKFKYPKIEFLGLSSSPKNWHLFERFATATNLENSIGLLG